MQDSRTKAIVEELRATVDRLNKLDGILKKMDVTYSLHRSSRSSEWQLSDVVQQVEYDV